MRVQVEKKVTNRKGAATCVAAPVVVPSAQNPVDQDRFDPVFRRPHLDGAQDLEDVGSADDRLVDIVLAGGARAPQLNLFLRQADGDALAGLGQGTRERFNRHGYPPLLNVLTFYIIACIKYIVNNNKQKPLKYA